ncbi:MAG: DNA repair exonuclease [Oscillospiraceae bacterium]|nr:DNA repair exonuclease [Oscillospiraceae bacterium]
MKLIHCSDIHLDSKMESNLTAAQARERNAEVLAAFARMVQYAAANQVDAVLIAGDLFDTNRVSALTVDFVLDTIRSAEHVDFLYLRGNHDESHDVFADRDLPANFKTFGGEWTSWRYGNVVITGLELDSENWNTMYDSLRLNPEDTNIVLLHGQESSSPGQEQIALPLLKNKNIHYLALGHIHSFRLEKLDLDGIWCYCGCLEGRGFDELGAKGFVLVNAENRRVQAEFVPFAARTLEEVTVDISGLITVSQIQTAMEKAAAGISPDSLVKFTLTGEYTLETQKDLRFLKKMLESKFWFVKIKDESRLMIDKASYEHDISLKGEFIRMVMASDRSEEEKEQIILCGIRALSGEEVAL